MLRLSSPGRELLQTPRLDVWVAGAEANVVTQLARLSHTVGMATMVPDNDLGRAAITTLRGHAVDTSTTLSGGERMGLYFVASGAVPRATEVIYDRAGNSKQLSYVKQVSIDNVIHGQIVTIFGHICMLLSPMVMVGCCPIQKMQWERMAVTDERSKGRVPQSVDRPAPHLGVFRLVGSSFALASTLLCATHVPAAPLDAQTTAAGRSNPSPTAPLAIRASSRQRLNFNADWRFVRGDMDQAQRPQFDDSTWDHVGLPHSFGTPYFQASSFYEGYGWYRKSFTLHALPRDRRLMLEFEGAFQEAEVFVNGIAVGSHRGGYTGFPIDITSAVRPGRNVVAVRVNNIWKATQAPRAGEHVFSGGIYRDVWLVATDAVHVPWTGTYVTTPGVDKGVARVSVESEVRNDGPTPATVVAATEVIDDKGRRVSRLPSETLLMPAGGIKTLRQLSPQIATPRLWTPETPTLYRVVTTLSVDGKVRDRFETPFGFRWFRWTADQGFFLNGKHRYFKGANVHQDHAGWGDAVTDGAIVRDVTLMKDAGFDFIRGSHYPHDPAFTDATDRLGLLFLSEAPFWGTGGFKEGGKWESPAYPTEAADRPAFEASVRQQLTEMIRIHRNHPSILGWSMGNETFFSAPESMPELRRFLKDLVALSHQLDPTRVAVIGGAQRGDIDKLGDVAAYNGDGATLFLNPGVPSMVSEYGSGIAHRPGEYVPTWGDLPKAAPKDGSPYPWRFPWRSGEAVWAGFDHGSIAGREFGSMGIIDYARLPKRVYYWYRNAYRGVAPPAWPKPGKAAALRITASAPKLTHADGTDDLQLIVTVIDAQGRAISNSPPVHLAIEAGPGELPTGRTIDFTPTGDIPIRDGQAAISMRSWQAGISRLRATSPGLADGTLDIATTDGPRFVAGVTPIVAEQPYVPPTARAGEEAVFGVDNPTGASSTAPGQSPRMANDGDAATWWSPAPGDNDPWVSISTERILRFRSVEVTFPQAGGYGFIVEVARPDGRWELLARQAPGTVTTQVRRVDTSSSIGERIRVKPITPKGLPVGVAEVRIFATLETR